MAVRERREEIFSVLIGEHNRGDGAAVGLRGHRDSAHHFAVRCFHGSGEQRVGEDWCGADDREARYDDAACIAHGLLLWVSRRRAKHWAYPMSARPQWQGQGWF